MPSGMLHLRLFVLNDLIVIQSMLLNSSCDSDNLLSMCISGSDSCIVLIYSSVCVGLLVALSVCFHWFPYASEVVGHGIPAAYCAICQVLPQLVHLHTVSAFFILIPCHHLRLPCFTFVILVLFIYICLYSMKFSVFLEVFFEYCCL